MNDGTRGAHPPGPHALAAIRALGIGSFPATLRFLTAMAARYGGFSSFRVGPRRIYLVEDPALVHDVLVAQQHAFGRTAAMDMVRAFIGTSIVTADEPLHRERRRVMQPAFHRAQIASYGAVMADELARLTHRWEAGTEIDATATMLRYTIGVTGRAIFGADVGERAAAIDAALHEVMATIAALAPIVEMLPAAAARLVRRVPPASRRFARARAALVAATAPAIADRARRGDTTGDDVLALLLRANDRLDDTAIADELVTLLFAGHETTAMALAWMWHALAAAPAAEQALHEELDRVCAGRVPTCDDLERLPYTRAVFLETLRLYPPAAVYARRVEKPVTLGGYEIAVGSTMLLSPFVTQRNPRRHANAAAFVPERHLGEHEASFAFFPFGGGARACIGERFAMLEGTLALATIAARFRLLAVDARRVGIASHATLRPDRPIRLRVMPRSRACRETADR
jgi:cytochrome P450